MKIITTLITITFFCFCCKTKPKILTIEKNGLTIKGLVINDSLFNDTVYTINKDNRIIKKELYSFGRPSGFSFDYNLNGSLSGISNYYNGLKHGNNYYFDTIGKLRYSDNYYYDIIVGPVIYYGQDGDADKYFFVSLDNKTLLYFDYREWSGVSEVVSKLIQYTYEYQKVDTVENTSLFLYLMKIPKFSLEYSLFKKGNFGGADVTILKNIKNDNPFLDISLPILNDSFYYSVRLEIYDSILNKKSVINKEVW